MTDGRIGRGEGSEDGRLPWLEPVPDEAPAPEGPSTGKTIAFVILGIVLIGAVVGGYSWWSQQGATEGTGELIAAPPGPYKVKPADPGGMEVEGEGDTAFAASEGAEPQGRIDVTAAPEAPVTEADAPASRPAPTPAAAGSIQLGAFSSEASASAAWKALSGRFRYLEPLSHSIVPVETDGRTLYRLRASGPGAANICGRLRIAGEACVTLN